MFQQRASFVILICLITYLLLTASAANAALKSESFTLKNGLTVIVVPNNKVPVINHMIWYQAGAIDEIAGKSGIAHFLEHLMFKGTPTYADGQFSKLISRAGGDNNAFTNHDYTAYYQNLAKDQLELAMKLEADRMQHLIFKPEAVEKEREVIIEERRMRVDNNPRSLLSEQMFAALYQNHPYRKPVIGWAHEMAQLTLEDAKNWYETYYQPNNAILVVSGDITAKELKPLAEKYYGTIPARSIMSRHFTQEPPHHSSPTLVLTDEKVANPEWYRYYLAPTQTAGESKHAYALTVLSYLLGDGHTSTLYQQLIEQEKIATSTSSYYDDIGLGPTIFAIHVTLKKAEDLPIIQSRIEQTLNDFASHPVAADDLERIKQSLISKAIFAQENPHHLSMIYGQAVITGLKPEYVENWTKQIQAVTTKQIQDAAKHVFQTNAFVTGQLLKP